MKTCDIIIPTYNNGRVLKETLDALFSQDIPDGWKCRLIMSDDGSRDETLTVARTIKSPMSWRDSIIIEGDHTGVAGARNRGLAMSDADIVLFLGADIHLRPAVMQLHLSFHNDIPDIWRAALGMVAWDPRINPTPLMEWMTHGGAQNDFDALLGVEETDAAHAFYCSHLSLKRAALEDMEFSGAYTFYGWEDLDLGRRLAQKGLRLSVLHSAVGHHAHTYSVSDIYQRQYVIGRGISEYQKQFPEDDIARPLSLRRRMKVLLYTYTGLRLAGRVWMELFAAKYAFPRIFSVVTAAEFWRGVKDAI